MARTRRNNNRSLCPCGSGKTIERCCGTSTEAARASYTPLSDTARRDFRADFRVIQDGRSAPPRIAQSLIDSLSQYPGAAEKLENLQATIDSICKTYGGRYFVATEDKMERMNATAVERLQSIITDIQVVHGRRLALLLREIVVGLNTGHIFMMALLTRALLECCGKVVYVERRLTKSLVKGVETQEEVNEVIELCKKGLKGSFFDWRRFLLGGAELEGLVSDYASARSLKDEPPGGEKGVGAASTIDELDRASAKLDETNKGRIKLYYGLLSDICHPSHGGDLLFTSPSKTDDYIVFEEQPTKSVISHFIHSVFIEALTLALPAVVDSIHRLSNIQRSLFAQPTSTKADH